MVTLGRPVFEALDFIRFPSETIHDNQWIIAPPTGKKISDELAGMPFCQQIQPLIGTADDGLYLRESDIKRLGLQFTGRTEYTRQGHCKVRVM
ncbi:hypothetical protein K525DRAFT_257798 [Schizophyllum commune Loenen D]|nr:hypothetical protein K525DRAFT_257798 [Schizophyllum commune Loenen D]